MHQTIPVSIFRLCIGTKINSNYKITALFHILYYSSMQMFTISLFLSHAFVADGVDATNMKERVNKVDKEKPVLPRITKELDGYVGFANFPNQVYRKAIKKGFEFTLMVVGKYLL